MDSIDELVANGSLPADVEEILPLLTNDNGAFLNQEGTVWDFKKAWPFSYSDAYFCGIARLICAFSNTEGGLIIFGVDDASRKGGHNKTIPNLDRLEQAFEQLTGVTPNLELRSYKSDDFGDIDILLVRKTRGMNHSPLKFRNDCHGYPSNTIFIRRGSQVREASSADIDSLYLSGWDGQGDAPPKGQLPPSPATVREFVGRMDAIDRVFQWLKMQDEPRAFLFGKGGSGKSTIAYQIYKSIKISGSSFLIGGDELERLIFVSAKSRYLDVESNMAERYPGNDFSNEKELYQALLTLGDWSIDVEEFDNLTYLKVEIRKFLNETSCFIVIDDIDTLTTSSEEPGIDFLQGVLWRAKKTSKILYTLRNRPSQSLASSLEIPGMVGKEFEKFVEVCAEQFRVPPPSVSARDSLILPTSEGRPLVIESIIALRRTAGNYPDAVKLFESEAGNDVRDYVFRREWDALDKSDRGREILTILALYDGPISVDDIVIIAKMDGSKVRDALASVQEIFLTVTAEEDDTIYSIGNLTRDFVKEISVTLNFYDTIKARVDNFKNTFYANSPSLNALINQFHRSAATFRNGEPRYLEKLIDDLDREKDPKLAEDPRFLCLRATARLTRDLRDVSAARADFRTAFDFKHCPDTDEILLWLRAEKASDTGDLMTEEIVQRVNESRGYASEFKAKIRFDRACYLYGRGKSMIYTEPHKAVEFLKRALALHLEVYRIFIDSGSTIASRSEEYARNTCFTLGNHLKNSRESDQFIAIIQECARDRKVYIDPVIEPLISFMRYPLYSRVRRKDELQRKLGRFQTLVNKIAVGNVWMTKSRVEDLRMALAEIKRQYASVD